MVKAYLFESERLGFRNWIESDVEHMIAINQDTEVMKYFPSIPNAEQTKDFVVEMQTLFDAKGFCYFAVDTLATGEFIGFIGISEKDFEADFTPCLDIGWRLKRSAWNKGFATEGAKRCLQYAFEELQLSTINSIAPKINEPSIAVMKKIGMKFVKNFDHPLLPGDGRLQHCVLYEIHSAAPGNF